MSQKRPRLTSWKEGVEVEQRGKWKVSRLVSRLMEWKRFDSARASDTRDRSRRRRFRHLDNAANELTLAMLSAL